VFPEIYLIRCDMNFKFFNRFLLCCHVKTEYTLVIDDDVIPARRWLEICAEKCKEQNAVISCTGRIIASGNFRPEELEDHEKKPFFIGDNYNDEERNYVPEDTRVDFGCNSYFFKAEWIRHFWAIWPHTFQSGEDMHLSASLMITCSIPTIVPRQCSPEDSGNLKKFYSQDDLSSWRKPDFIDIRESVLGFLINDKKWKPILWQ